MMDSNKFHMKIHEIKGYMQSIYLVEYTDKLLLLDGGSRVDVVLIQDFIEKQLNRNITDLKLVVVTHVHPDHAGGVSQLKKISKCKVAMANKKPYWYAGSTSLANYFIDIALAHLVAKKSKKPFRFLFYNPFITPDVYLSDGQALPNFTDWVAIHTQGHTDRDLTLVNATNKIAYTADLIIKTRRGFIPPFPIYMPKGYRASLEKVKSLALDNLLLAHGSQVAFEAVDFIGLLEKTPKRALTNFSVISNKIKKKFAF